MRIVHLPFYDDNPYQSLLIEAQRELGYEVWEGGGGGNFIGVALREWKADLVHFHWLHPYLLRESAAASIARSSRFLVEVALLKARGARIVWTIHNLVNHDGKHANIERWFSAQFAKKCDRCFVHSQAAADAAGKRFSIPPEKLSVIPHGHYLNVYPNTISPSAARETLKVPADARVYLFLGRIEPYKGVFDLIDAFRHLPSDCHLLIAGKVADSALLPELEEKIRENPQIHLHPKRIPDEDMQCFYKAADVVVFPFQKILTSGSLVLAMSFGKAVLAPQVPSLEEVVPVDGVIWFTPGEADSLADALFRCQNIDVRRAGTVNLEKVRTWDWQSIAKSVSLGS